MEALLPEPERCLIGGHRHLGVCVRGSDRLEKHFLRNGTESGVKAITITA